MKRSMSRRGFLTFTATSMVVGVGLAACQAVVNAPATEGGGVAADEQIELNLWGFTGPIWEAVVDAYMEQNPTVDLNLTEIGDVVFGDQKFLTAVAGGSGPDVAVQNKHTFAQFAAKGLYQDVTSYFDSDGYERNDFFAMQLNEVTWEGNIYGLPRWGAVRYLHWNREHFREVGLDPDVPPTTWAELEEYAALLNKKDANGNLDRIGFVPYLAGNSWMWLYGGLNGAPALSADKRTVLCDDARWVDALQWMVNFYDNHIGSFEVANAFSEAIGAAGLGDPFTAGKMSMSADGDWAVATRVRDPELDWNVAPMPIPPDGQQYSWSCGFCVVMAPSTTQPDAAWELMKWWTNNGGWRALAAASIADTQATWEREQIEGEPIYWPQDPDYIPSHQMVTDEFIAVMPEHLQQVWAVGQDLLMNHSQGCGADLMGLAALDYWVEMDNAVRAALSHKVTPEAALVEAKNKVQEATDRAWESIESS